MVRRSQRIASRQAICDQAQADAARAVAMLETSGQQAITPQMVQRFARTARERIKIDGGRYPRDHLRALAWRVEAADREVRIIGSKSNLLQTLTAAAGAKPATHGDRSSVLKWRIEGDSNAGNVIDYGNPQVVPNEFRAGVAAGSIGLLFP